MSSAACEMGENRWSLVRTDHFSSIDGDYGDAWWFTEGLKTHGRQARIRAGQLDGAIKGNCAGL